MSLLLSRDEQPLHRPSHRFVSKEPLLLASDLHCIIPSLAVCVPRMLQAETSALVLSGVFRKNHFIIIGSDPNFGI